MFIKKFCHLHHFIYLHESPSDLQHQVPTDISSEIWTEPAHFHLKSKFTPKQPQCPLTMEAADGITPVFETLGPLHKIFCQHTE